MRFKFKATLLALLAAIALRMSLRAPGRWLPAIVIWCMVRQCLGQLVLHGTWASTSSKPSDRIALTRSGWLAVGQHRRVGQGRVVYVLHRLKGVDGTERTFGQVVLVDLAWAAPIGFLSEPETTSPFSSRRNENV